MKKHIACFAVFIFLCDVLHAQSWVPHSTGNPGIVMRLSFPSNDTGYAINDANQIRKTVDGALTWSLATMPVGAYFTDIHFFNYNVGVACGDSSIYRTTNGASTWSRVFSVPDNGMFNYFHFVNPMNGFVSYGNANLDTLRFYATTDGGVTWNFLSAMPGLPVYSPIFFTDVNTGYYGESETVGRSIDGGVNWDTVFSIPSTDIIQPLTFANADTGYFCPSLGDVYRTTNAGLSWGLVGTAAPVAYDLHFINGRRGFVCGGDGFSNGWIMKTTDAGVTWNIDYQSSLFYNCFSFPSDSVGYAGGQGGYVLKYSGTSIGISENNGSSISISPNPAKDILHISSVEAGSELSVFSIDGKLISAQYVNDNKSDLDVSKFAPGCYFIAVSCGKNIARTKFIKQ